MGEIVNLFCLTIFVGLLARGVSRGIVVLRCYNFFIKVEKLLYEVGCLNTTTF